MARSLRKLIREGAEDRCEYCRMPQSCTVLPHEIDHIRARKHHGPTTQHNTCLACAQCNGSIILPIVRHPKAAFPGRKTCGKF